MVKQKWCILVSFSLCDTCKKDRLKELYLGVFDATMHDLPPNTDKQEDNQETEL